MILNFHILKFIKGLDGDNIEDVMNYVMGEYYNEKIDNTITLINISY